MAGEQTIQLREWLGRYGAGDNKAFDEMIVWASGRLTRLVRRAARARRGVYKQEGTAGFLQEAEVRLMAKLRKLSPLSTDDFFRLAALEVGDAARDLCRRVLGTTDQMERPATSNDRDERAPGAEGSQDSNDRRGLGPGKAEEGPVDIRADDWVDRWLLSDEIRLQVGRLPERQRDVVSRKIYLDLTLDEIAEQLGVSPATVKRDWNAARLTLAVRMKPPSLDS